MTENTPSAGTARTPWTYVLAHEAWYAEANRITTPVINVHHEAYTEAGARDGVEWEFEIKWIDGRIRVDYAEFTDAVLDERPDLVRALALTGNRAAVEDMVDVLQALGFVDTTDRDRPSWLQAPA